MTTTTPSEPESAPDAGQREALQSALAAEHAAVYGYGVVGGVLGSGSRAAVSSHAAHRGLRDQLTAQLGGDAVAAEAAYSLPLQVTDATRARRLARELEARCAAVYADVVGRTTGQARVLAAQALTECALRGMTWGSEPEPFPGLDEL
ncbi:MAG: DUF4439 domain-containing protein [Propionibacteriales bacterium]|nr:DUF4439 domain-containing protein [Propionibacteriales bacterium]